MGNENDDVMQKMIGSVIELQKVSNEFQQQANIYLEKIASKRGLLATEHEKKIIDKLKTQGKITKREIMAVLSLSPEGALELMKRLDGKENIFYVHGRGKHSSYLIMAIGTSSESKAMQIARLIPRGSEIPQPEIAEKLNLTQDELRQAVRSLRELFPREFSFEGGKIIHYR